MEGCRCIIYSPGMFPVVSNEAGKVHFNTIKSWALAIVRWSWEGAMFFAYVPENGLLTVGSLVKGLLNGPGKGVTGNRWS